MDNNENRIRSLNRNTYVKGNVLYWMSRDQRIDDNWALLFANVLALKYNCFPEVVFTLTDNFLEASFEHFNFMLEGLKELEKEFIHLNIPFKIISGDPVESILSYISTNDIGALVCDFSPLKISRDRKNEVNEKLKIPFYEVDSHNIVPVWEASNKQEYSARTIRPKIQGKLDQYLNSAKKLDPVKREKTKPQVNWDKINNSIKANCHKAGIRTELKPGVKEAEKVLDNFVETRLNNYTEYRNNPVTNVLSDLSPYLHFGQISSLKAALEVENSNVPYINKESFLDELVVRKELSDNFCFYNENYDNFNGLPNWGKNTLTKHKDDIRESIYTPEEFENAITHDNLWNAAQKEMTKTGKMHGYMRMYWAKKILEWSITPEEAINTANYLNNKYELDGRDPNGYVGVAWAIGGLHDRPWFERSVYGLIRYMSYSGASKKFKTEEYIKNWI